MPEQSTVRDPRSLFDIDERLVELMDQVADAAADRQEPPSELIEEINEYIEAFHTKVDRIAGYLRWQESIASICGAEAERLSARKKSAEGRVSRLKNMLLHAAVSLAVSIAVCLCACVVMRQHVRDEVARAVHEREERFVSAHRERVLRIRRDFALPEKPVTTLEDVLEPMFLLSQ